VPGVPVHFRDVPTSVDAGVATHRVHSDPDGSQLDMRVVVIEAGSSYAQRVEACFDEVLYVMSGTGTLRNREESHALAVDTGLLINGPATYSVQADQSPMEVVVVRGRTDADVRCGPTTPVVDLAGLEKEAAVSQREFQIVFDPARGCSGMTQFVGYVPAVRTPRHFHPYDEMLCILRGRGTVEIEGREVEVGPGFCYYLPAGCVHLVQNTEDQLLVELGVFTPAGSPTQNTPVE
jgi:quercetin dioxygenase-like cupin family protein